MVWFQLIMMFSYVNNKLLMCSDTLHQGRRRQMCGNFHKFTRYTHFLSVEQKMTSLEQSIHGMVSTHYDVLLCK